MLPAMKLTFNAQTLYNAYTFAELSNESLATNYSRMVRVNLNDNFLCS